MAQLVCAISISANKMESSINRVFIKVRRASEAGPGPEFRDVKFSKKINESLTVSRRPLLANKKSERSPTHRLIRRSVLSLH